MNRQVQVRHGAVVALLLLVCSTSASSKERPLSFPIGTSDQIWNDQDFEICMPPEYPDEEGGYSLIVTLNSGPRGLSYLVKQRFIVVAPRRARDAPGHRWNEYEIKRVRNLTAHLVKKLRIKAHRVHAVGIGEEEGVFFKLAFEKKSPFVSATFVETEVLRTSVAKHLQKQMGVLCFDWPGEGAHGLRAAERWLAGKVRTVELRSDRDGLSGVYFQHWLRVMEGEFTPGHDLSFNWRSDPESLPSIDDMDFVKRGYFVYFWSKSDKDNKHAKRLQNEVLLDHRVRRPGRELLAFRLEREAHKKLFESYGLAKTPAVVVVEPDGRTNCFQGRIKVGALSKALKRANTSPRDPWGDWADW